ncbi:MAG: ATP synthase subunit I [Gammaproteobacteria bacterium]
MTRLPGRQISRVLIWQVIATGALALLAAWVSGKHGAWSAGLGGLVSLIASLGFAGVAAVSPDGTAGQALRGILRAEAMKIILIVVLLWAVLSIYKNVVSVVFIGTFIVTSVLFSLAAFISDE